jgi:hypothetical protein
MKRRNFIAMIAAAPLCRADDGFYKYFPPWDRGVDQNIYPFKSKPCKVIFFDEEGKESMFKQGCRAGSKFPWEEFLEQL